MNREKIELRDGWVHFIQSHDWDEYVTLSFNQNWSINGARKKFSLFCQRLDRYLLGRRYRKRPDRRTRVIAFLEHPLSNIHFHCFVKFQHGYQVRRRTLKRTIKRIWEKLVRSGAADVRRIKSKEGAARYSTKEFHFDEVVLSSEFWPTGDVHENHPTSGRAVREVVK